MTTIICESQDIAESFLTFNSYTFMIHWRQIRYILPSCDAMAA